MVNQSLGSKLNGINEWTQLSLTDANDFKTNGCLYFEATYLNVPNNTTPWIIACIYTYPLAIQISQSYHGGGGTDTYIRQHVTIWSNWQLVSN